MSHTQVESAYWLERGIETILDASFCLIMRPCHCSSSVLALFADDAIRQFCLICWPLLSRELRGVRLLGQRHFLPSKMAADARPPGEKGVSKRCGYALTDAWPHYEADMIRLSPLGSVAYILANRAITLTNDRAYHYNSRQVAIRLFLSISRLEILALCQRYRGNKDCELSTKHVLHIP